MGAATGIAWTDATFNPWWGCTKVSPACDHCYAERLAKRFDTQWGTHQPHRFFGDKHWQEPLRWNEREKQLGIQRLVFCASMADVFDNAVEQAHRERLWALIKNTPHLTWQILTKRPGNAPKMLPVDWGSGYPNVWMGVTVENQTEANRRIPLLLQIPATCRFLSAEPLLEEISLLQVCRYMRGRCWCGMHISITDFADLPSPTYPIHWVICGGESGPRARPLNPDWARSLRDQCRYGHVAFFMKQGSQANWFPDFQEFIMFPLDLQIREFPSLKL